MVEESALRRRFWKALDRAGLRRLRIHDLRHSYGSLAVRAYRLDEVRAYMGHADLAMTMRYVHHVPAHDAAQRLSAVLADVQGPLGARSVPAQESATKPANENRSIERGDRPLQGLGFSDRIARHQFFAFSGEMQQARTALEYFQIAIAQDGT